VTYRHRFPHDVAHGDTHVAQGPLPLLVARTGLKTDQQQMRRVGVAVPGPLHPVPQPVERSRRGLGERHVSGPLIDLGRRIGDHGVCVLLEEVVRTEPGRNQPGSRRPVLVEHGCREKVVHLHRTVLAVRHGLCDLHAPAQTGGLSGRGTVSS
jgi:hypothetical protein